MGLKRAALMAGRTVVLDEPGAQTEPGAQGLGELHLEPHQTIRVLGIVVDVGRPPLRVVAPPQDAGPGYVGPNIPTVESKPAHQE